MPGEQRLTTQQIPDRYVTFKGIDGDGNARRLLAMLGRHFDDHVNPAPFWEYFKGKLALIGSPEATGGRRVDELFLVHAYINNIREILEEYNDLEALALLEQIEVESC